MISDTDARQDKIVFDIETQKDFSEVGGRNNLHLLKISVLGFFSFKENSYFALEENEIWKFVERLKTNPILIGFNIKNFDLEVLKPYLKIDFKNFTCIDIMDDVIKHLGFRLPLEAIAFGTLNKKKSADGLEALKWFKQGEIEKIKNYCLDDVALTKEIYEFGLTNGYIKALAKNNLDIIKIPVSFKVASEADKKNFHPLWEVFNSRNILKIKYLNDPLTNSVSERTIAIYNLKGTFIEAFDFNENKVKLLRLDKIIEKKILDQKYEIPADFISKL